MSARHCSDYQRILNKLIVMHLNGGRLAKARGDYCMTVLFQELKWYTIFRVQSLLLKTISSIRVFNSFKTKAAI